MEIPDVSEENQACEVPLVEQLRSIPEDYRTVRAIQWSEDGRETGHQFIPVGFIMHRAAAEIERLRAARPEGEAQLAYEKGLEDAACRAAEAIRALKSRGNPTTPMGWSDESPPIMNTGRA